MRLDEMTCRCLRCGHKWFKRITGRPEQCPNCTQPNWDIPKGELAMGRPPKKKAAKRIAAPAKKKAK
jgi:hypothetical protein